MTGSFSTSSQGLTGAVGVKLGLLLQRSSTALIVAKVARAGKSHLSLANHT